MAVDRFAVSLLSKGKKSDSLNEEVMINKDTGEILVKSTTGFFVSYDKFARLNSHINKLTTIAYTQNTLGKLYELDFDNYDLPAIVPENNNLISAPTVLFLTKIKKMIISMDLDNLRIMTGDTYIDIDPLIEISLLLATNSTQSTTYTENIIFNLDNNNIYVFEPRYPSVNPGDVVDYSVNLNSITVVRNNAPGDNIKLLLHSILFVVEGV
jgi:hypothetical protein